MPRDDSRDYYADLELPATADISEIKKQFRKLALIYHPDRNPGKEAEVNSKFQIIQSAHEVLSDPERKSKYDATRRSKYPGASGVRGNPWQDVGKDFPAPPRRTNNNNRTSRPPPPPPPSGAAKYRNFTQGAAPTAKQQPKQDNMEDRRNAWQAFEQMRPSSQGKSAASQAKRPVPPRPTEQPTRPVPRTPGQKQKAEAAFGARKTGFAPSSPVPGDEPSVSSSGYTTTRHTYDAAAASGSSSRETIPDPLAQFREKVSVPHQSAPYSSGNAGKADPFDEINLGRAKSTRESTRHDQQESNGNLAPGSPRNRSSSAPRNATSGEPTSEYASNGSSHVPRHPFVSRASARYTPAGMSPAGSGPTTPTDPNVNSNDNTGSGNATKPERPSMYGTFDSSQHSYFIKTPHKTSAGGSKFSENTAQCPESYGSRTRQREHNLRSASPSGDKTPSPGGSLTPFENEQRQHLADLIKKAYTPSIQRRKRQLSRHNTPKVQNEMADQMPLNSFTFPVDDETFTQTTPTQNKFGRSSADDINTRFVNDQSPEAWRFNAGSPQQEESPQKRRAHSSSRLGPQSPLQGPPRPPKESLDPTRRKPLPEAKWNANIWSDLSAESFTPQTTQNGSASPTRPPGRAGSRKQKINPTMGSAGLVNDDSSSNEEVDAARGRMPEPAFAEGPVAMDIDSPPPKHADVPEKVAARNIPVEPSRPEWRPGNVQTVPETTVPIGIKKTQLNPNNVGSEDSEEFQANLADLRNVAPFAQKSSGLGSFGDLKSTLPFESRPAEKIAISREGKKASTLEFPRVPQAPSPPPALAIPNLKPSTSAWQKYLQDFQNYMQQWDSFSAQVTDHFATRKQQVVDSRMRKGYSFLTAHSTEGIQEYLEWVQQDRDVRRKWVAACDEHELRIKDFLAYRAQMGR